ncbi:MAG: FtsX-like permease family protein [Rectinemataceae bacterium]
MRLDRVAYLSRRWLSGRKGGAAGFRSGAAAAGLAAGVAALIVILGVMNGLQGGYIDSILEISSFHLRVKYALPLTDGKTPASLAEKIAKLPGIRSAVPLEETHVMAVGPSGRSLILALKAVPADLRDRDPDLVEALGLEGAVTVPAHGGIVAGREAADILGLYTGGKVELLGIATDPEEGLTASRAELPLAGTFKSGYYEFDSTFAFVQSGDESFSASGAGSAFIGVKLDNRFRDKAALVAVEEALGPELVSVQSWRDYNRSFFGALRTEKTVMIILVGLIFVVVGVNIRHAMRRKVAVRMQEIAALRAMGASAADLRAVFTAEGLAIGLIGALSGAAIGLLVATEINGIMAAGQAIAAWFANLPVALGLASAGTSAGMGAGAYQAVEFYMESIPVRVSPGETLFIVLAAVASAVYAAASACSRALDADPAEVLRNE